ncbi:chromosome partitioning protein [Micromonospora sp. NPDC049559]|uniref:MinD/ParA family ATP-binding protein n=1 Tax=Micromonospora sp. NPDC049559 TaxID=3155923 RepID=UPI00342D2BA5
MAADGGPGRLPQAPASPWAQPPQRPPVPPTNASGRATPPQPPGPPSAAAQPWPAAPGTAAPEPEGSGWPGTAGYPPNAESNGPPQPGAPGYPGQPGTPGYPGQSAAPAQPGGDYPGQPGGPTGPGPAGQPGGPPGPPAPAGYPPAPGYPPATPGYPAAPGYPATAAGWPPPPGAGPYPPAPPPVGPGTPPGMPPAAPGTPAGPPQNTPPAPPFRPDGSAPGVPSWPGQAAPPWPQAAPVPPAQPGAPGDPLPEVFPGVAQVPQQPYAESGGVARVPAQPATGFPEPIWTPDGSAPTAEEFARRRAARPADPVATMGVRAAVNKTTMGLVRLAPGRHEQEIKQDVEMVRRNFGGLRQVTVVNPKGGAGKTVAILLLAMTFGQKRGGYVLAWDNNETQGTLGMRAQQDFHSRTVRDLLRDLGQFQGAHGRVGDLSQYVRSQGEGMFDVLASDESATGGEMLTAGAFAEIREVVSRFYKLIFVDTGNNVRAQNWQAAIDATDQLLVTMSARNDSAETAARMLDHLEQSGRQRLVRQAVTVVSMPPSRKEIDLPAIQRHFAARTRAVLLAPYERLIDTGEPIRYGHLSSATRDAWLKIAAAVAEGL